MRILEILKTDEPVIDNWTTVFDDVDPLTGDYLMLATDHDGFMFSQWTDGQYEPDGDNSHLGYRPRLMSEALLDHILWRMRDDE
jgi:hypothetical protein